MVVHQSPIRHRAGSCLLQTEPYASPYFQCPENTSPQCRQYGFPTITSFSHFGHFMVSTRGPPWGGRIGLYARWITQAIYGLGINGTPAGANVPDDAHSEVTTPST